MYAPDAVARSQFGPEPDTNVFAEWRERTDLVSRFYIKLARHSKIKGERWVIHRVLPKPKNCARIYHRKAGKDAEPLTFAR